MPTDLPQITDGERLRVIAYGGGVQSSALVVLATQRKLDETIGGPVDAALFCNTGDDSEDPLTLAYVRDVMTPWAAERGVTVETLTNVTRDGTPVTLRGRLLAEDSRSLPIPVFYPNGAPAGRACTSDFKVAVIARWLKQRGATKAQQAVVALGISTDEVQRANPNNAAPHEIIVYPLLNLGLDRAACQQVIRNAGLPVPPKSSCFFCPYHRTQVWAEMRRDRPGLFEQAAEIEDGINAKRQAADLFPVFLTRRLMPLRDAVVEAQDTLGDAGMWDDGTCDSGVCFV